MRVLIVSQYYRPENVPIPAALAEGLASAGHSVRVLTGYPNYPGGRVFEGYRQRWRGFEQDREVELLRVPLFPDHSNKALRRLLNYLSFGLSASTAANYAREADVIYVYATQMTAALGPWLWRVLRMGPSYVLHIQDLWPDSIIGSSLVGRPGRLTRLLQAVLTRWLTSVYRHASAVIAIAPTMAQTLIDRGVPEAKVHLVYNWAEGVGGHRPAAHRPDTSTRIVYAGNVGEMQDLDTAVLAAHHASDAGVHLTILGDGVALPRIQALAEKIGCTNVEFRGRVPLEGVAAELHQGDFALVSLRDLPVFRGTIPSKFQTALANGVPVISSVQGDARTLVERYGMGITCDAEDPAALEAAFRRAAAMTSSARSDLAARANETSRSIFAKAESIQSIAAVLEAASKSAM